MVYDAGRLALSGVWLAVHWSVREAFGHGHLKVRRWPDEGQVETVTPLVPPASAAERDFGEIPMPIPDYQSLMLPVLLKLADGKEHSVAQMRESIASEFKLTDQELAERLASGTTTVFMNRIGWAVQYLKASGAIKSLRRGVYQITDRGASLLKGKPSEITAKALRQFPEFLEFHGKGAGTEPIMVTSTPATEMIATPEESLEHSYQILRDALVNELLETVKSGSPAAFERIVVDLLVAMGYGGTVEDAGKVVGKVGDGGIDGTIKQDKLGLDFLYVQAKRWKDVVGSQEIMKFSGSLTKRHANRGVFITTSWFSKDALEYVEEMPQRIILIDGKQLASLMIEHNVGVAPAKSYTLKRMDQDYFENL